MRVKVLLAMGVASEKPYWLQTLMVLSTDAKNLV